MNDLAGAPVSFWFFDIRRENYAEILKNDNMHRTGKMNNGGV